jgi:ABC-2 type transport system permease protein
LLLTLPASDFDIVIGKYMAAAAIFTASLLFSQLSTFTTLAILTEGSLDIGLIFTTYLGYWFVGLTMLAIGMIASFLTGNLTVGFILGALFNAPLAFASLADSVSPSKRFAEWVKDSGISRPFDDFGRGVISSSSVIYFLLVAAVALYVCMILIGRRHWRGGKDGNQMAWHYVARAIAMIVFTVGAVMFFRAHELGRKDMTEGQVSSLADATKDLIQNLNDDRPIVIDAFISNEVPELYAQTRYELINLLKEFRAEAAKKDRTIEVNLYDGIDLFSDEATLAAKRFGIEPRRHHNILIPLVAARLDTSNINPHSNTAILKPLRIKINSPVKTRKLTLERLSLHIHFKGYVTFILNDCPQRGLLCRNRLRHSR